MNKRFVSIWFPYLKTDWFTRQHPGLRAVPFVLSTSDHGKMIVSEVNQIAKQKGITKRMAIADARAILPSLKVFEDVPEQSLKLLKSLADWCIRFTPVVSISQPDGLILDATGCAHLWGGEQAYLDRIKNRLNDFNYKVKIAIADTIGAAWAIARFSYDLCIVETRQQANALSDLPAAALRIEPETLARLCKLGLKQVKDFISMPGEALRRRFGDNFITKLNQSLGLEEEYLEPVIPFKPYQQRLAALEPITTATGIAIALEKLVETVCTNLKQEEKGIRTICFSCYRIDGKVEKIEIGTNRATNNIKHVLKLFELKTEKIEPGPGIELFTLDAKKVEKVLVTQETIWKSEKGLDDIQISELIDRFTVKFGADIVNRYLPAEHHWPERSYCQVNVMNSKEQVAWKTSRPRPLQLLNKPEPIEVTAPIPDYPPMLFRYKGRLHKISKADGPERIESEWWIEEGQHRDYYYVEDEAGYRYWLFRLGHYSDKSYGWFIHGFFS